MSRNDGPRIESLSSMVGGKTPTTPQKAGSAADEKGVYDNDIDSVYDEEEIPATRESDFKHKQVRQDNNISRSPSADQSPRSSKAGAYSCE